MPAWTPGLLPTELLALALVDAMQDVVQQRCALLGTPLATATA